MKFEIDGFDELEKRLKKIEKGAQELEDTKNIEFSVLFNDDFMKKYTKFNNITNFFENSKFDTSSNEAFKNIDEKELDEYVSEKSDFDSWKDMLGKATEEYAYKKLGL